MDVRFRWGPGYWAMLSLAAAATAVVDEVKRACRLKQPLGRGKFFLELQLLDDSWVHVSKDVTLAECIKIQGGCDGRLMMRLTPKK